MFACVVLANLKVLSLGGHDSSLGRISRDIRVASRLSSPGSIHQLTAKAFLFYRPQSQAQRSSRHAGLSPLFNAFCTEGNEGLNKIHCIPNSTSSFTGLFQCFKTVFIFKSKELKVEKPLHNPPILSVFALVSQEEQHYERHCVTSRFPPRDCRVDEWQAAASRSCLLLLQAKGEAWLVFIVLPLH